MNQSILERDPGDPRKKEINPLLKLALELGPLMVFFFANARGEWLAERFPALAAFGGPIFIATGLFMIATAIALAASWSLTRSLPIMPLVSGVVVFIFGGLTLYLQDDVFIKMKPTIIYALFAVVLLGGLVFGRALLGYVLDSAFHLDAEGWRKLTFRWGVFFLFCAAFNEVLWRGLDAMYPTEQADSYWAGFKLFGFPALTFVFILTQMPLIMRHSLEERPQDK